jgi:hypothetical protein
MKKIVYFLVVLSLSLSVTGTALAQDPVLPAHSDPAWRASYWNNTTLSGSPAVQRSEADLKHDWGAGSPDPALNSDGFSARWTRYIDVADGVYVFSVTSDDGARLWVDNELLIDQWYDHPARTFSVEKRLSTGHHYVVLEYYENQGLAVARLDIGDAEPSIQGWRGEYYSNASLSGSPALVRDDARVYFDWGAGSPAPGTIGVDRFSIRWTRNLDLPAGQYRFTMTVDDGARLWVNGHLLIDQWKDQPATSYSGEIYLPGGPVPVKMEYYENGGLAVARLSWDGVGSGVTHWRGEYFNNTSLAGAPALVRDDAQIAFDWGNGSPAPGVIAADRFSARWTRTLDLSPGRYRFAVTGDDGVRLWVNGQLLIDAWYDQAARTYSAAIDLAGGAVPVKLEYYENAGLAVAELSWSPDGVPSEGVIVDDTDPGFVYGGAPAGWREVSEGYGGHLTWTWNNDWQRTDYNWARWFPFLSPGRYEVFVYIPERYSTTSSARYLVAHADGYTSRLVDQSTNGDRWVSLGTYNFNGSNEEYVSLTDATGEARRTRLIAFDAVKWEPR